MKNIEKNQRYLNELASLEKTFQTVPKPHMLSSCHCCHDLAEKRAFINTPLKQLSGELLGNFMFSVFNTIGDVESFKYFLPRALELVALDEFDEWCDIGLLGRKLAEANYQQWSNGLPQAVDSMLRVIWQEKVLKQNMEANPWGSSDYLCMIGNAVPDIYPYLSDLFNAPRQAAVFWENEIERAREGQLSDSFWENEANKQVVIKWVLSKRVEDLVMPIYLENLKTRYNYE